MTKFKIKFITIPLLVSLFMLSVFDASLMAQSRSRQAGYQSAIITIDNVPLRSGDALFIDSGTDTTSVLYGRYVIDDKGKIYLPIKGELNLKDYSQNSFEKFLLDYYRDKLVYPNVRIRPLIRVGMVGGFVRPGFYYADPNASFWELMVLSGGPLERKLLKKTVLLRGNDRKKYDLLNELKNSPTLIAAGIQSGDVLEVPNPTEMGTLEKFSQYAPIFSSVAAVVSIYITYQIYRDSRR